jgi:hypothetical protein
MKLVASFLLLGGSLGLIGLVTGGTGARLTEPSPPAVSAPADPESQPTQVALRLTILARPLFAPDRRPVGAAIPAAVIDAAPVPPPLGFIGTVRTEGQLRAAVTLAGKRWLITVGETVSGWQVEAIGPDHLLLRSPDGSTVQRVAPATVSPRAEASTAPAPSPAAAGLFPIPPLPALPARPR